MRRLIRLALAAGCVAGLGTRGAEACSMCRCGDPTFALVGSQIFVPRTFHLGFDAERYSKDQVSEDDPAQREAEVENRWTLSGSYTVGRHLTLVGRLPFADRSIEAGEESQSLSGLSNPELDVYYRVASPRPGSWLSTSLGLVTPWGKSRGQIGGETAEQHVQPSTGAWTLAPGLSFSRVVGAADDRSIYGSAFGRINGHNDAEYHYGSAVLANLGYERKLGGHFNGILELNYRWAARDEIGAAAEPDPNTGGSMLYVSPRLVLKLSPTVFLRLGVQIPVIDGLYGDQKEKTNFQAGLTRRF